LAIGSFLIRVQKALDEAVQRRHAHQERIQVDLMHDACVTSDKLELFEKPWLRSRTIVYTLTAVVRWLRAPSVHEQCEDRSLVSMDGWMKVVLRRRRSDTHQLIQVELDRETFSEECHA